MITVHGGQVILHNGKTKVVVSAYPSNENLPEGRCALMCEGKIEWHDTRKIDAKRIDGYPKYAEISQFNYREKQFLFHKAPKNIVQAMVWARTMGGIRFLDVPDCGFGNGLYKILADGTLEFVQGDWDSSG